MFTLFNALKNLDNLENKNFIDTNCNREKVKLKNGSEVSKALLDFTLETLQGFISYGPNCDPMSLFYLVQKCKDPAAQLMPFTIARLKSYKFLDESNNVPLEIKNIVLCATREDQTNIPGVKLIDPTAELSSPTCKM